jgi:multiple sugar transport system substrate-binding protein
MTIDTMVSKITQLAASGRPPDILLSDSSQLPYFASVGLLLPLSLSGTGLSASNFEGGPFQSGQYKGVQYGLPVGNNGEVIIYNKSMLAKAGITHPPQTWNDLTTDARKLTKNGVYGFAQTLGGGETTSWNYWAQLWAAGGSISNIASPQAIRAAAFWASFVLNGSAPRASLEWQSSDIEAQFVAGKLAMGQIGTWEFPALVADAKTNHVSWGSTPQVHLGAGPSITPFGGEVMEAAIGAKGALLGPVDKCIINWTKDQSGLVQRNLEMGLVPSYIPAQASFLKQFPQMTTLIQQLSHSRNRVGSSGPCYPDYSAAVATALQQIASGQKSAATAMQEAKATAQANCKSS